MKSGVYRPSGLVRWFAPCLPYAWQETLAHHMTDFLLGWGETRKIRWAFYSALWLVVIAFVLLIAGACWLAPQAMPIIMVLALAIAWWGYGELGLASSGHEHREWVKAMVNPTGNDVMNDFMLIRAEFRWKLDLLLIYGRPDSVAELEHLRLHKQTTKLPVQPQPRPRL